MAQLFAVGRFDINPKAVSFLMEKANGLIDVVFSSPEDYESIDYTSISDPNSVPEIVAAFEATNNAKFIQVDNKYINPDRVSRLERTGSLVNIIFREGWYVTALNTSVIDLLDERLNGQNVIGAGSLSDNFALAFPDSASAGSGDYTANFDSAHLYAGQLPSGITFSSGVISGLPDGRWLVNLGIKYTSGTASSLPRAKILVNNLDEVGNIRPNYPVASEWIYQSHSFVRNLQTTDQLKVIYGDNNPASSSYVIRLGLSKLAYQAPVISNPNDALTIGGIVVLINGDPLVI